MIGIERPQAVPSRKASSGRRSRSRLFTTGRNGNTNRVDRSHGHVGVLAAKPADSTSSTGSSRRHAMTSGAPVQPASSTKDAMSGPSSDASGASSPAGVDSTIAAEKRPCEASDDRCTVVDMAPADSPKSVTRSGSPPKARALACTQRRASRWSPMPALPGRPSMPDKKPRAPRRYATVMRMTLCATNCVPMYMQESMVPDS
mmetsp:Transcript_11203/g.35582  ORF Transcript_11203/g.35582 Transcript_11203/m.35582 type:complete len:202 (+) Transcript_11203:639-1244(+)